MNSTSHFRSWPPLASKGAGLMGDQSLGLEFSEGSPGEDENDEILGILVLQVRSKWELVAAF